MPRIKLTSDRVRKIPSNLKREKFLFLYGADHNELILTRGRKVFITHENIKVTGIIADYYHESYVFLNRNVLPVSMINEPDQVDALVVVLTVAVIKKEEQS